MSYRKKRHSSTAVQPAPHTARVIWDKYNDHQRGTRRLRYRFKG